MKLPGPKIAPTLMFGLGSLLGALLVIGQLVTLLDDPDRFEPLSLGLGVLMTVGYGAFLWRALHKLRR